MIEQQRDLFLELILRFRVRNRDPCPALLQEKRRRDSRLAEPDHQHALVGEVQNSSFITGLREILKRVEKSLGSVFSVTRWWSSHRNFRVVSANRANTNDAIQKRTITFDSDQPSNSKWW